MASRIYVYTCTKPELWVLFDDVTSANKKKVWKVVTTQREKDKIEVVDLGPTFSSSTWYNLLEAGRLSLDNPTLVGSELIDGKEKMLKDKMEEEKECKILEYGLMMKMKYLG